MRPPDELAFILARTLEWIAEHPPTGPLLVEHAPRQHRTVCKRGHDKQGQVNCPTCNRDRKRVKRKANS